MNALRRQSAKHGTFGIGGAFNLRGSVVDISALTAEDMVKGVNALLEPGVVKIDHPPKSLGK